MTIREKGYHKWDGELQQPRFRWLPMTMTGVKAVFKKKFAKTVFSLTIAPFLVFLVGIYVSTKPELKMLKNLTGMLANEGNFFNAFLTNGYTIFMLLILGVFFGAELISSDKKFNSFPLYFSRPLDRKDYIAGKYSILMFYYLLFTLVPGLLLYIFKMIFTGKISISLTMLSGLIFTPLLVTFYLSTIVLMISSLSSNTRYVKIIVVVVYFFSDILGNILYNVFREPKFMVISIRESMRQLGVFFFNLDVAPPNRYPPWMAVALVVFLSVLAYKILDKQVNQAEAQLETGN
jgi:ABC-type transport system involved in multi-copper enzyme maturation permease subunit